ncbi:hypothetical protein H072_8000 [Dactylellina haptotyla CBS 200.50]|uniref:Uncharacterized protein n=1 Tax=Dactylellina haptotyla (strain CBS 200.50) TaxID=1284197 RepID=S8BFY0_DACHA|nr:hypothetical protein H072_8000 [Dactylellina haptotyla CBS 200.50]
MAAVSDSSPALVGVNASTQRGENMRLYIRVYQVIAKDRSLVMANVLANAILIPTYPRDKLEISRYWRTRSTVTTTTDTSTETTITITIMGTIAETSKARPMMATTAMPTSIPTITMSPTTHSSHRCPDGFITFVTNHADKDLGFTIFLSLFIHSAVDGFTMCLPLYLALQSGWKAVGITFLIGGLAQPLGGLIAYIWLNVADAPSETVYGIIFSFTAGLMSVVAVQLLRQIPSDHKHPDLPYISMLAGVVLMCLSLALTSSS